MGRLLREMVWRCLKELNMELLRDSVVSLLGVDPKAPQTGLKQSHVHAASQQRHSQRRQRAETPHVSITG